MSGALAALDGLSAAEEFLEALEVPYDPAALAARRLLVLRRFRSALAGHTAPDRDTLRALLAQAYREALRPHPADLPARAATACAACRAAAAARPASDTGPVGCPTRDAATDRPPGRPTAPSAAPGGWHRAC